MNDAAPLPLKPLNQLEEKLRQAYDGSIPIEEFVEMLFREPVFTVFHGKPTPQGPPSPLQPLVFESENGFPALCVFTHPDRYQPFQPHFPEFESGLLVAFTWVLQCIPDGVGLVINPGYDCSIEQPPEGIAQLKRSVQAPGPS